MIVFVPTDLVLVGSLQERYSENIFCLAKNVCFVWIQNVSAETANKMFCLAG